MKSHLRSLESKKLIAQKKATARLSIRVAKVGCVALEMLVFSVCIIINC